MKKKKEERSLTSFLEVSGHDWALAEYNLYHCILHFQF